MSFFSTETVSVVWYICGMFAHMYRILGFLSQVKGIGSPDMTRSKPSPDLNLTPLAAFLRFLPSAARVRSDLSQFSWGRSEPKVVRWQIKDQSCFSYPEMMFQIDLCYFLCWLVSLLLSWVQWNYSIGGKCCANVRLLQNTFTLMHLSSQW